MARGLLRTPVASPRPWLCQGIDPIQSQQNVSPFNHSRETSLSLHPSTWRAFLPPRPLTTPLRPLHGDQGREHSRCPSLEPSHRPMSLRAPWNPDQPCADWMPPSCRRWITLGGLSPPPNPARRTWRLASPPTPNHAQSTARLISTTPWGPFHGYDVIENSTVS